MEIPDAPSKTKKISIPEKFRYIEGYTLKIFCPIKQKKLLKNCKTSFNFFRNRKHSETLERPSLKLPGEENLWTDFLR